MNRMKMMGLCLVAMFAFGAIIASAAQAGEFGNCVKSKTGKYNNNICTTEGAGKTKYEWVSAAGEKSKDSTKSSVLSSELGTITSKKSKGTDEITGFKTDTATTEFEDVVLTATKGKCENLSKFEETGGKTPYSGEVTSYNHTELLDHGTKGPSGLEPAAGEVWDVFAPLEGSPVFPYDAYFICEPGVIFRTFDTVSGVVQKVNTKPGKSGETLFGKEKGEQDLATEFSENGGETFSSTGANVETTTAKSAWNSLVEVRACEEPSCTNEAG
jgi:hypothetical protein